MIRILIADDHGILRAALRNLLNRQPDIEVIGEAATARDTLRLASELHPDVVLLDISLPDENGIAVARHLNESQPDLRVLILTANEEKAVLTAALKAGACGYVVKRAVETELIGAIDAVMRGDLYVHPAVTRALVQETMAGVAPATTGSPDTITRRETEVLGLLAQGLTNAQIAERLTVSIRTAESHRANLIMKLGLRDRAWAALNCKRSIIKRQELALSPGDREFESASV